MPKKDPFLDAHRDRPQVNSGGDLERRRAAAVARGWTFPDIPATGSATVAVSEYGRPSVTPSWYTAGLGSVIVVHGTDLRELLHNIENWEGGQSRLRPEFRSRHLPPSHPLAPAGAGLVAVADGAGDVRAPDEDEAASGPSDDDLVAA